MAVPLPSDDGVLLVAPDNVETAFGFVSVAAGPGGLTEIQRLLFEAVVRATTDRRIAATDVEPVTAREFAQDPGAGSPTRGPGPQAGCAARRRQPSSRPARSWVFTALTGIAQRHQVELLGPVDPHSQHRRCSLQLADRGPVERSR